MQVTQESRRVRWIILLGAWVIAGVLLYLHSAEFYRYIELLDNAALRGASAPSTPLRRICPTMYADVQMWTRHALALADGAGPQLRYTHVDNAPFGREVHWNSLFAWLIVGSGWVRHLFSGESLSYATEQILAWFNVPLLMGFVIVFSAWLTRRAGAAAGVFLTFAMIGHLDFYSGFSPNYVDHHGVLAAAVLGLLLGGVFMGVGFWRASDDAAQFLPASAEAARRGAIFSAVWGAIGLWVSAATLIPAIVIMGVAGALAILLLGRNQTTDVHLDPSLWRLWGKVGASVAFALYLLEYAPFHLGFRLEVNHPAYAAGWWGGAEIIAQLAEWRRAPRGKFRLDRLRAALALLSIAIAPTIIAIGGPKAFVVFDPFITRLSRHVAEGISFPKAVELFGMGRLAAELPWAIACTVLGVVAWFWSRAGDRVVVLFCILTAAASTAMAVAQIRWWPSASGAQICLIMLGVVGLVVRRAAWLRWTVVLAAVAILCSPAAIMRIRIQHDANVKRAVDARDAMQPIYRDIAATLRASQPEGDIVLLTSPNGSAAIGYYGQLKTIGTLYWENLSGTKEAAEMFSAQSEVEARQRLRERGVTHVAMISEDNFLAEYFDLLNPPPTTRSIKNAFGYQLLIDQTVPLWLEQIPYECPTDLPIKPARVTLFKTHFVSAAADAAFEAGLSAFATGARDEAERKIDHALELEPKAFEYWVAKTNLLLLRHDTRGAFQAVQHAIENAKPAHQLVIANAEASRFYQEHAHAEAEKLFRTSLALHFDPLVANNLAWLLATSTDDAVRKGAEALEITEALRQLNNQQHPFLAAHAAALAECGRFAEAVTFAAQALEAARAAKDQAAIEKSEARLARYRNEQVARE